MTGKQWKTWEGSLSTANDQICFVAVKNN